MVWHFKQPILIFKQHYTYFYTFFYPHVFPKNTKNITRITLPNGRLCPWVDIESSSWTWKHILWSKHKVRVWIWLLRFAFMFLLFFLFFSFFSAAAHAFRGTNSYCSWIIVIYCWLFSPFYQSHGSREQCTRSTNFTFQQLFH